MASNKLKLNRKILLQITLVLLGILIIFFTYFYNQKQKIVVKETEKKIEKIKQEESGNISSFEDIIYNGEDSQGNRFTINSEYAEFENDRANIIYMKKIICRFFFKDGTILRVTSDKGIYDNIKNDIEFEENVKMYYLENRLFSEKASFVNSENYLLVEDNVVGESPDGNLLADKIDFDLIEKNMKISMYNKDKVNIKVNY